MAIVLDYQNPQAMDGAALADAGIGGVLRYLYNLTVDELADLWAHGVAVAPIFEHFTSDYTGGYAAGLANGQKARSQATSLGFLVATIIYCAVDTRTHTADERALAVEYFRGFRDGAGASRPYGDGAFIDACVDAGLADLGWMPETWGPCDHLCLVQLVNSPNPFPSTDRNIVTADPFSGHNPNAAPPPAPTPEDPDMAAPIIEEDAKRGIVIKWYAAIANRKPEQIDAEGFMFWTAQIPDGATPAQIDAVEVNFHGAVLAKMAGH